jgi:hypothetical protein
MKAYFYPICSVYKAAEGGISQKDIRAIAKRRGIECQVGPSVYVGQTAVYVRTEDKRKVAAFVNELLP